MTISVHDVIAYLLARKGSHSSTSSLHKMAYFAQGWHLAWSGAPLFDEEICTREGGPFIPAMFQHQKDGYTETSWSAGNTAAVTAEQAKVLDAVFRHYAHLSGITLAEFANAQAPCLLAMKRATEEDPNPVVDLAELKAFFKALDDAPKDPTAYANRFMDRYADEVRQGPVIIMDEFHVIRQSDESRRAIDRIARQARPDNRPSGGEPVEHVLIGPRFASASLPDDDYSGWHWKCSCGAEASSWIQNWPESEDEAREEWRLHFS